MSLKAIEMQIALPRTQDAGKIHEQLQQRGQISQDRLAEKNQKEQEKKRVTVNKNESKDKVVVKKDTDKKQQNNQQEKGGKMKEADTEKIIHPYKGTKIDFSG
ncbi:hypothetical protein ACFSO7_06050 [Bacillus sp. CGMCC 1.16607]|uniref:hypothetical protein n=1 Tax=Bacillus sp. CGMCC 1.16607 TaxID=3351842 RepID=UPI00362F5DA8